LGDALLNFGDTRNVFTRERSGKYNRGQRFPHGPKNQFLQDSSMPTTFTKDAVNTGFLRSLITKYYRGILVTLMVPLFFHQFGPSLLGRQYDLARFYTVILCVMIFTIPLRIWSTWAQSNWGESLTFADDLRIQKKDGTTVIINRPDVQQIRVSQNKMIIIVWKDAGKSRCCVIGKDCFTTATWSQLESHAQTWLPKP